MDDEIDYNSAEYREGFDDGYADAQDDFGYERDNLHREIDKANRDGYAEGVLDMQKDIEERLEHLRRFTEDMHDAEEHTGPVEFCTEPLCRIVNENV